MDNKTLLPANSQQSEKSVIIYRSEDGTIQLEVQLYEETVWLTQHQMTILFETTKQNVSLHVNNAFKEGELERNSVVKDFLTTILIDNYIDDSVLKILNKRKDNVSATIYTSHISENLKLDLQKHNSRNDKNDSTFPLPVKIFRLGECTSPKPGVYELSSTVWKKTTS